MNRYKENMININISKSEVITFFFSYRKLIENLTSEVALMVEEFVIAHLWGVLDLDRT